MHFSKAILIFFSLFFFSNIHSQVEFQIAPLEIFSSELTSQKDCVVDMNGDYLDDIVIAIGTGLIVHYQQGNGQFLPTEYPLDGQLNATWNITAADFNRDGLNDLGVGNDRDFSILLSDTLNGSFVKTTMPDDYFVQRTAGIDLDLDGDLDIFSCNDVAINQVFENNGNGGLTLNTDLLPTLDLAGNYSHVWCDYDNDGDSDLQISKCYAGTTTLEDPERINLFYQNNGDGTYTEIGESINMDDPAQSWVTNMQDFDNDGDFDAYIANHDFANRFMINNGDGTFTDIIDSTGIDSLDFGAIESFAFDFDNNGFVDILMDSKKRIWLNNGDLTFTPLIIPMFMFFNTAIGDLNNDGFLDMLVGANVWLNQRNDNNWVKINTAGVESNPNGIGARVEIYGDWGVQVREVRAGHSFSTMSTLNTHFGIGSATSIDSLVVKWPSGLRSTKLNPSINSAHLIEENDCVADNISIVDEEEINFCQGEMYSMTVPSEYVNVVWNNGFEGHEITVEESGVYFATMLDSDGCFVQSNPVSVTFILDELPSIFPNGVIDICKGDTITLTATSAVGEYDWNNGATSQGILVADEGMYFVEAPSNCSDATLTSEAVEIVIIEVPAPIVTDIEIAGGENVTLTAEGEGILWFSSAEGGNVIMTGPEFTTPFLTMDVTYYVSSTIVTTNGMACMSERVPVNVLISNTEELLLELGINAYPNPAKSFIQLDIQSIEKVNKISLLNSLGQEVIILDEIRDQNNISLLNIPSGNYNLIFETSLGTLGKKIVVSK